LTSRPDKKEQILQAARICLARHGFEKTTMDDIGGLVGLNKASLYYYFDSKEALVTEVVVMEAREFLEALQAKVSQARGCRERILTYLRERVSYYQKVINLHHLSMETLTRVKPLFQELYQGVLRREIGFIEGLLGQCRAEGEIGPCDASRVAEAIITVADAIKHKAHEAQGPGLEPVVDYTQVAEEVVFTVSLILDGLGAR